MGQRKTARKRWRGQPEDHGIPLLSTVANAAERLAVDRWELQRLVNHHRLEAPSMHSNGQPVHRYAELVRLAAQLPKKG